MHDFAHGSYFIQEDPTARRRTELAEARTPLAPSENKMTVTGVLGFKPFLFFFFFISVPNFGMLWYYPEFRPRVGRR